MLCAWQEYTAKQEADEISRKEYDNWRYHYPEFDTTMKWVKVMSQGLSDMLTNNESYK